MYVYLRTYTWEGAPGFWGPGAAAPFAPPQDRPWQCMHNWYLFAIFHLAIAKGDNIVAGELVKIYYFTLQVVFTGVQEVVLL